MPGNSRPPLPRADLEHVLDHTRDLWDELRGARLFVSGGTGFFGGWMVESLLHAQDRLALGAEAIVLTRGPKAFEERVPHLASHPAVRVHEGDVRDFAFPDGPVSHILHLATESGPGFTPAASFATAVHGTERVLELARGRGARSLLLASSGAVYGPQPPHLDRLDEDYAGAPRPEDPTSGYAQGKRAAEHLCAIEASTSGLEVKIARCFAFVGPLLPLEANFAIGNFIRDALAGEPIHVNGDGTARRTYLYAADLAIWLWTILFRGRSGRPFNVGAEDDLSISELAGYVADVVRPGLPVEVTASPTPGRLPARYVPSTDRARNELGVTPTFGLDDGIRRTADWYSGRQKPHGDR
jgi:dTDP-glucose 4,6-dehydratase